MTWETMAPPESVLTPRPPSLKGRGRRRVPSPFSPFPLGKGVGGLGILLVLLGWTCDLEVLKRLRERPETKALPVVWQKKSDFLPRFDKLAADCKAAEAAIKDEASFKTEWPKVTGNCGGCHKEFRKS